jgi:hypothetical protein
MNIALIAIVISLTVLAWTFFFAALVAFNQTDQRPSVLLPPVKRTTRETSDPAAVIRYKQNLNRRKF